MGSSEKVKVVGDGFCVPYTMELEVRKKVQSFSNAHYDVVDATGNLLLQVDGGIWNLHRKRVIKHPSGLPLITLREKGILSWKDKWEIHEGESDRLVCSVQQSSALQMKNKLHVYLPTITTSDDDHHHPHDFCVTGTHTSLSFKVHRGNSIIAEASHHFTWASCKGKQSFKVRVYPEVDYAFIVALLVILNEIDNQ